MPEVGAASGAAAASVRYRPGPDVLFRVLDGDTLAYVGERFETHLLDPAASLLVSVLAAALMPLTLADLHHALLGAEPDDAGMMPIGGDDLLQLLGPLLRLGIVDALPC
jgi:hypothetical protein